MHGSKIFARIQSIMFGSSSFGLFFALPVLSSRIGCSAKQIILLANLWQAASWAAFGLSTDATLAFMITACFFLNGIWWPTFRSVVTSIFGAAKYQQLAVDDDQQPQLLLPTNDPLMAENHVHHESCCSTGITVCHLQLPGIAGADRMSTVCFHIIRNLETMQD